jgi:23S rRNA pseudouridine1911/1915/1917 synthase
VTAVEGPPPRALDPEAEVLHFRVGEDESGERLDRVLAALAGVPRSRAQRWIDEGCVRLDGRPARGSRRVAEGASIEVDPPEPVECRLEPEAIPLRVLYEDADLIVLDKQPGLVARAGNPRECAAAPLR